MRSRARATRVDAQPVYVLHRRAWRETSALIEVFSAEYGRIGLLARGMRGPRSQSWQALLQPMQAALISWSGNGELPQVTHVDPSEAPIDLRGEAVLSGLYLNELILNLLPRHEPNLVLFARYGECVRQQQSPDMLQRAWHLRLFERDLLAAIGFPLQLDRDCLGSALLPGACYLHVADSGILRACDPTDRRGIPGSALIALRDGSMPEATVMPSCRRWLRELLAAHLGWRELHAWSLMQEIRRL